MKVKGKQQRTPGAYIPSLSLEQPVGGSTNEVCNAWPSERTAAGHQTYGYLPSRRTSLPLGQYQIILLGDREAQWCEQLARSRVRVRVWSSRLRVELGTGGLVTRNLEWGR